MIRAIKQYLYNPICLSCGSFFVEDHLCCKICFSSHIEPRLLLNLKSLSDKSQYAYLIDWVPGESDLISEMVYRFKNDQALAAWSFYSRIFAELICEQIDISKYDALVPLPGSKITSVHAKLFASQLSGHLGLPVFDALRKTDESGPQKLKSLSERTNQASVNAIQRLEVFTNTDTDNLNLIYVDDIMTTGTTYKRSKAAMQNPNNSLLITLFCRPKVD